MSADIKEYLQISLHEKEKLLHTQWLRNVNTEEYRAGILLVKQLVIENDIHAWLTDARRLNSITVSEQQWLRRDIAPAVQKTSLEKVARVIREDIFNYISFENLLEVIIEENKKTLRIGQFSSVEAALAWIQMD